MLIKNDEIIEIFGELENKIISTDYPALKKGDEITIVNSNCEFEYDNYYAMFNKNLLYYYIVDLKPLDVDLSGYECDKSNNGGGYAYLDCEVVKVKEKSY